MPVGFQLGTMFGRSVRCSARATTTSSWPAICTSARWDTTTRCAFSSKEKGAAATTPAGGTACSRRRARWSISSRHAPQHDHRVAGVQRRMAAAAAVQPDVQRSRRRRARLRVVEHAGRPAHGRCGWRTASSSAARSISRDFGVGVFADAGRLWAGDIPYGVTTPVRTSVGVSLLGTVPPASARHVANRLGGRDEPGDGRPSVRAADERHGQDDVLSARARRHSKATRERTVPSSVFRWPR